MPPKRLLFKLGRRKVSVDSMTAEMAEARAKILGNFLSTVKVTY
jgi:hypothetical protein